MESGRLDIDFDRRPVSKRRVQSMSVVEDFDVVMKSRARFSKIVPGGFVHEFLLKSPKEALDSCVVVAVARSAHADLNAMLSKKTAIRLARVLATAIRMMQGTLGRLSPSECAPKSL